VLVKHHKEIRATGNSRGGIPKIYGPWNSRCELPEFWRFSKIVTVFWILIVQYYVKSVFFELCFGEQWVVVPHFEFMELLHDLLRPEATNSNLFSQQHCQYDLRKYNFSKRVIPTWNSYQLPHHRHHRQRGGLYTEWENSVKLATHGPTLTAINYTNHK